MVTTKTHAAQNVAVTNTLLSNTMVNVSVVIHMESMVENLIGIVQRSVAKVHEKMDVACAVEVVGEMQYIVKLALPKV